MIHFHARTSSNSITTKQPHNLNFTLQPPFLFRLNLSGVLGWSISVFLRGVNKTIVDFTLLVQMRHPSEIGGMYWSWNIAANQLFCFVSVYLYTRFAVGNRSTQNNSTSFTNANILCNATDTGNTMNTGCDQAATELPLRELVFGLFILSMLCLFGFLNLSRKNIW